MAASQLMAAIRLLTTLAMPRPMPTAIAHPRALIHEKPTLVGSNGEGAVASLRTNWYPALSDLLASIPHNMPMPADKSFHIRSRVTSEVYLVVILVVSGARIRRPRLSFTRAKAEPAALEGPQELTLEGLVFGVADLDAQYFPASASVTPVAMTALEVT